MRRRQLLNGIAAGSVLGLAAGVGTGRPSAGVARADDFDELRVVRDGEVVDRVVDPSPADVDRLHAETGDAEDVVTPAGCCSVKCLSDCDTCSQDCCLWSCQCTTCSDGTKVCDADLC